MTQLTPLQRAFLALEETRAKLDSIQRREREPLAIVGIGCRTPGDGDTPEKLWNVFSDGVDAITSVPPSRWDADAVYDSNVETPGKTVTRQGGFVRHFDTFDPGVFGISPREAQSIDPQQRLLLEVVWEALEHAGIAADRLMNSRTGVYVGMCTNDFLHLQLETRDLALLDAHFSSGIAHSIASGRLSYLLGLQGPSITIDTACSSGLVAVHYACQSLRTGECRMAIAAGVNIMLSPDLSIALSHARILAPDGRCKTFDAAADGYGRGEGCGVVILKRLSDAVADGDRILAQIRGTAVNQDGPSSGLTAPNGPAQEAVIRQALESAGLAPNDVGFIEAHGTGTQLGDPLEMRALGAVFGAGRPTDRPLYVSSAKSNFGHLEAAAGIIGLVKLVLSLQHQEVAPSLHFNNPNPHIPWDELPVVVPTKATPWPEIGGTRVGGVSSFGFSGTNAHVVVEQAPPVAAPKIALQRPSHLLTLSAQSDGALSAAADRIAAVLDGREDSELGDIAYTLNTGRALFPIRAAFAARTIAEAREKLASIAHKNPKQGVLNARVPVGARPRVAFLFTGQGTQYADMARSLYETAPVFRQALDECAAELDQLLPMSLLSVIYPVPGTTSPIDQTGFAQPALFAVEYALATLWKSWGVEPAVVLGHSVGEVVAACVAGVLSLPDALKLIAARGRLMQSCPPGGAMLAVFATRDRVEKLLATHNGGEIAAINGPNHIVLSGPKAALDAIGLAFETAGIKSKALVVSHAFHSALMDPILTEFESELRALTFNSPRIRLISNVTGQVANPSQICSPSYWRDHIRKPVRFSEGIEALGALKCDAVVEIGPAPVLTALGQECLGRESTTWCASLRRGRDDWDQLLDCVMALHMVGVRIDWAGFDAGYTRRKLDLPTYPFQRERYWFSATAGAASSPVRGRPTGNPLLGSRLHSAAENRIYEARLRASAPAFIAHHRVLDRVVLPATAYLDMLLAAARDVYRSDIVCIDDVTIAEAMLLEDGGGARVVQTVCGPASNGAVPIAISSQPEREVEADSWVRHVTAKVRIGDSASPGGTTLQEARDRCTEAVAPEEFYRGLNRRGGNFGDGFQVIRHLQRGDRQAVGRVVLTPDFAADASAYRIHPALLDGCLQVMIAALPSDNEGAAPYLPIGIGRFALYGRLSDSCWSHAGVQPRTEDLMEANVSVFDNNGTLIAELGQVQLQRVGRDALNRLGERWLDQCLFETQWKIAATNSLSARASEQTVTAPRNWLLFADLAGVAAGLAERLRAGGDHCTLVSAGSYAADTNMFSISPTSADDYRRLIAELHDAGRNIHGVVHAWSLDAAPWMGMSGVALDQAQSCGAMSMMLLAQALVSASQTPRIWLVTCGAQEADTLDDPLSPAQAPAWGFGKALALEHPELHCVCVDLSPSSSEAELDALAAELAEPGWESHVALRNGERRVARLAQVHQTRAYTVEVGTGEAWRLVPELPGALDQFSREPFKRRLPGPGEIEIATQASGLNFKDVLSVLGMYPGDPGPLGAECAGRVTAIGPGVTHVRPGDAVMALASGSFASHVITPAELVQPLPAGVSAEEGASFPVAFLTAEYCLSHLAGMRAGNRVLVHAAAGGVGMAAVKLAQRAGAEVFATAGSKWKRELLHEMGVTHVFDSRSAHFADEILARTGGRGVDLVLNSLSGELIDASFSSLARGGTFVEIGKRGIKDPAWVAGLDRDLRYFIVDWNQFAEKNVSLLGSMLARLVDELRAGTLTALPRHVFDGREAARAFRFMAQARHVGKIVVRHERRETVAIRRDGTYLVTGGLSGLGLVVASWLSQRGAGRLVLIGRRGVTSEAAATLDKIRANGTIVVTKSIDVSDESAVRALLNLIRKEGPPLRGVVHSAGVLDDAGLIQQNLDRFTRVFGPKVRGGWLLDRLTRSDALDWFVMFSSIAAVLGSAGQTNHAAANAFLDLLAHERRIRGLPGTSIDWGPWMEVGAAVDRGLIDRLASRGVGAVTPSQGLIALERLLEEDRIQTAVAPIDWHRYLEKSGRAGPPAFLASIAGVTTDAATDMPSSVPTVNLREQLAATPPARRRPLVATFVRERALRALGVNPSKAIDPRVPLGEMGLDSLLSVELRNTLSSAIGQVLPATLLFDYPTIDALTNFLLKDKLDIAGDTEEVANLENDIAPASTLDSIESLSDDEVDRLLAARAPRSVVTHESNG